MLNNGWTSYEYSNNAEYSQKLHRIADAVLVPHDGVLHRTCIIIHWKLGYQYIWKLLQDRLRGGTRRVYAAMMKVCHQYRCKNHEPTQKAKKEARKAAQDVIDTFNDQPATEPHILLLPADTHSEGVDLKNVREVILADLSPEFVMPSWTLVKQRIGRATRLCSHNALDETMRDVRVTLYISTFGDDRYMTVDEEKLNLVMQEKGPIEQEIVKLQQLAIDAPPYYGHHGTGQSSIPAARVRMGLVDWAKHRTMDELFPLVDPVFELDYPDWYRRPQGSDD
jgi:hypothetical protein